jgi:tetratricopeptide (TPR) repeat protein
VVEDRRPQIVTILGHPGMGKSRIATELTSRVDAGRATVVTGRCLPYAEQTGFRASADHVKRLAGILETDPPREAREKLGTMVADLVPAEEAPEITRYLSLLLGLGTDEPTDDRLPLFFAMRRLIESLAAARPTIAAFEDLHWADESQLDLLEYLAQHIRDVPLLFLVLGRPELLDLRPTWGAGLLAHTSIPLEPLAPMDAAAIATHTLRSASSDAVDRLVEVAGGNPLFIEELAASLEEGAEAEGSLPATVREAISSRIDVLPTGQREVLLDASVIGKTFWRGVLRSVAGVSEVDDALTALEARDLIRRIPTSRVEGDVEYTFKHMLIREVAYATIARAARRERHAVIARYLEEDAANNERELAWLLAHHWREAGDHARAVDHLLVAAELARERWAKEEVSNLYEDVLQLVGGSDIERRNRIRLLRGIDLVDLGDLEAGAKELDEIIPMLHGRDQLEAILARLRTTFFLEETEQAFSLSKRAIELATELGDPELLAPSIGYLSGAYIMTGELANAREENRRALSLWVPNSRRADLAAVKELHAEIYYWIGEYQVAEELSRSAYEIGGEVHRVESLLRGGGWQGLTLAAMGRTEESMDLLDRIIERARELGQPRWAAGPLNYSSQSYRDLYLVDEARRRNEESLEMVTTHGEWGMPRLQGSIDLLLADLMQNEVGQAQAAWPELWEAAINGKTWRPWLGGVRLALVRAEIALETEGPETSIDWAHETIVRAAATGRIKYEMLARAVLGNALMQLGRAPEAIPEVRTAVRIADRLGTPAHRWQTRAALGRVLMAVGKDDGAQTALTEARGVIEAWAATLSAEHAGSLLAAEPVRDALETTK